MRKVVGWKLYYSDNSIFTSKDGAWQQAPSDGVLGMLVYYDETYEIWRNGKLCVERYRDHFYGGDYYWLYGTGLVKDVPNGVSVKLGVQVEEDKWWDIYNKMHQDVIL